MFHPVLPKDIYGQGGFTCHIQKQTQLGHLTVGGRMFQFLDNLSIRNKIWLMMALFIGALMVGSVIDVVTTRSTASIKSSGISE